MRVDIKQYPHTNLIVRFFKFLKLYSVSEKIESYLETKRVKIRIDDYDTWNLYSTLSQVIVPLLEEYQNNINASAIVEFSDVPENLLPSDPDTAWEELMNCGETDEYFDDRWKWVVGEMIYAFESYRDDNMIFFTEEEIKRVKNGMRLFAKYYGSLWD